MKRKLCVVTGFDDKYHELAKISIPNYLNYVNRHNLDLHISTQNFNSNIHWGWNKYYIISKIISQYDWVVWIDIDCLFINKKVSLRDYIDDSYSLILGENKNPPFWYTEEKTYIENGVFLLKNDEYGKSMLNLFMDGFIDHPWHDQYKMIIELRKNEWMKNKTKKLDLIKINAIDDYKFKKEDMFIYHCSGGSSKTLQEKIQLLKYYNE